MFGFRRRIRPIPEGNEDTSSESRRSAREARQALHQADWETQQIHGRRSQVDDLSQQIEDALKRNGFIEGITSAMRRESP